MKTNNRSSNKNDSTHLQSYVYPPVGLAYNEQSSAYSNDNGLDYVVLGDTSAVIANSNDTKTPTTNNGNVLDIGPSVHLQNTKSYNIRLNIVPRIVYEKMDSIQQSSINPISYMLLFAWSITDALLYYYTNIEPLDIDSAIHTFLKWMILINVYNVLAYIVIHINSTILFGMKVINMLRLYIMISVISNIFLVYAFSESSDNTYIFAILIINTFLCFCMLM